MADYQNPFLGQNNPYLQNVVDSAQGDMVRNYNLTAQPAFNAAMVKSGSFGNAGVQQMNENGQRNLQQSLGDVSSKMRFNDFQGQQDMYRWDQEFGRSLYNDSYGQNLQNLQTGIGLLGTMNGYNTQDLNNGTTIQNTPLNYYSQFQGIANGIGNNFASGTQTQGTSTSPVTSAIGGAQLGQSMWQNWAGRNNYGWSGNNYNGSSTNASAPNYENQMDMGNPWGAQTL